MKNFATERYHVKNLDCATCAAKIENALKRLESVEDATLDFANLTLHVKAKDLKRIIEHVRKIEPDVELIPENRKAQAAESDRHVTDFKFNRELFVLILAFLLFSMELFFENWIHRQTLAYLEQVIVFAAYFLAGWNVIIGALRTIRRGYFFDENVLMVIATGGAIAIHAYAEAVGVMIFYKVGELLQERAVSRSRRSIQGLLAAKPDRAFLKTSEGLREVAALLPLLHGHLVGVPHRDETAREVRTQPLTHFRGKGLLLLGVLQ